MDCYEPELMYALDTLGEYSDWKNVYNVSGNDVLYCPICLGRVKLWNGQDPNKKYKKQKCFHHIDRLCSQESRIHFAYKMWLFENGSKFKVGENIYEVTRSEIEKTFHTKFGDYRPDIIVETSDKKLFYIEIADSNKKTEDYIEKWDELGCDVLELDVNEQLAKITTDSIPEFKIIYSSSTGECYIKHYMKQDYDDLITERKKYWKRIDILNYKIQWELLDWFWRKLQDFYLGKSNINTLIEAFRRMHPEDQRFVCSRMRGKHSSVRYELENNYTNKNDSNSAHLKHISSMIKNLNNEFGYSSSNDFDDTYLFRKDKHVIFKDAAYWKNRTHLYISDHTTEKDVYDYFHPIMQHYYNNVTVKLREELNRKKDIEKEFHKKYSYQLENFKEIINNSKNASWEMSYNTNYKNLECIIYLRFLNAWENCFYINMENQSNLDIKTFITTAMNDLLSKAKESSYKIYHNKIRIMEERI